MPSFAAASVHDDYDPRKSDFIKPATDDEVVDAEVDLKRKQIAKLQTLVSRLDSQKQPNRRKLHYQATLEQLQRECQCLRMRQLSRDSFEDGSTAMPSRELSSQASETSSPTAGDIDELSMDAFCSEEESSAVVAEEVPATFATQSWRPGAELAVRELVNTTTTTLTWDNDKVSKTTTPPLASALWNLAFGADGALRRQYRI